MNSSSTELKEIRTFGTIALFFFGALCLLCVWRHREVGGWVFGVLSATGLGLLVAPGPLRPLYHAWLKIAHVVGVAVTAVALTVAFYAVITPAGLLKRVVGGRPLPLKPDPERSSYWVSRQEPVQPRERFVKRY